MSCAALQQQVWKAAHMYAEDELRTYPKYIQYCERTSLRRSANCFASFALSSASRDSCCFDLRSSSSSSSFAKVASPSVSCGKNVNCVRKSTVRNPRPTPAQDFRQKRNFMEHAVCGSVVGSPRKERVSGCTEMRRPFCSMETRWTLNI